MNSRVSFDLLCFRVQGMSLLLQAKPTKHSLLHAKPTKCICEERCLEVGECACCEEFLLGVQQLSRTSSTCGSKEREIVCLSVGLVMTAAVWLPWQAAARSLQALYGMSHLSSPTAADLSQSLASFV